jgi:hypothetical protein
MRTPNIIFGFRLPGGQVTINIHNQALKGFVTITGDGGIYAIRAIFDTDSIWVGRPEGYGNCRTDRLVAKQGIKAFSAELGVSEFPMQSNICQKV